MGIPDTGTGRGAGRPGGEAALREAVGSDPEVVLTTGGTGLSPTDGTPEATLAVLDRQAPRHRRGHPGCRRRGRSADSDALPGSPGWPAGLSWPFLPGSTGVRDGSTVLAHAVSQARGGDH